MSNELVRLTTQEISKAIPVTNTIIISEKFQVSHLSVVKLIDKYREDFEDEEKLMSFEMTRDSKQRSEKAYQLTEQQFYLLVTYMKNTEIARKYKKEFVKQFTFIKKELLARSETRVIAKKVRKSLTDSIKNNIPEGNFKKFAYSNYTKTIYKKLFGKTTKELKEIMNVPEGKNIRDYFSVENLEKIQDIESEIATILEFERDINEKELFQKISIYIENKYRKLK